MCHCDDLESDAKGGSLRLAFGDVCASEQGSFSYRNLSVAFEYRPSADNIDGYEPWILKLFS